MWRILTSLNRQALLLGLVGFLDLPELETSRCGAGLREATQGRERHFDNSPQTCPVSLTLPET